MSLGPAIGGVRAHGLNPPAFALKGDGDEALTMVALSLAKALAYGVVDPRQIDKDFTLKPNRVDLAGGLAQALAQQNVGGWITSLAPADNEYKALSAAYLAALGRATHATPGPQPPASGLVPAGDQARQLAVNLERRRWLNRSPPGHRIDVNTAGAFATYLKPGATSWTTNVVAGRADHQTPGIEASFHKLIANPPWKVPKDIAAKEVVPKGPGYMAREDMHWEVGLIVQAAGPKSALGRVKFDVEDPFDIYLHDTPDKWLFALPDRHRSHGCVRVQNALDLAAGIASETGKADDFSRALASTDTTEIDLGQSIPVRMLYHSAYLGPSGHLLLAADDYGSDDLVAAALGLGQVHTVPRQELPDLFGP